MKKIVFLFCLILCFSISYSQSNTVKRTRLFDTGWRFIKDSAISAEAPGYNDSKWRIVNLPHDWSIEDLPTNGTDTIIGPFSKKGAGKNATAFTEGGTAWYRKSFVLDKSTKDKKVFIQFDGVYMNSDVWINGHHLGNHPNGYTSFIYELTSHLNPFGEPNIIAVQVKNEGDNSRYYSGSGIYRHVWLSVVGPTHIKNWGVQIVSNKVSVQSANIQISTLIENFSANLSLTAEIYSADNKLIISNTTPVSGKEKVLQNIIIKQPKLWDIDNPNLYKARLTLRQNGKIIDQYHQNFGVRSIHFDTENGFTLNGKSIKLKGGCIHHDNGPLGAAAYDRAEERKIELLKKNGYNAVRFAHNPYSPQILDACDRLGILVINEAFDMWNVSKTPDDYSNYFKDWWQKDLTSLIMRDFNHPSVIMWSIGNEIQEVVDTLGYEYSQKLTDFAKALDTTRAITSAIPFHVPLLKKKKWSTTADFFKPLDVGGYNYAENNFENDHKLYPDRIMMVTEYFNSKSLENWNAIEKRPYAIGMFSWAAIDYLGEAGIGLARLQNKSEKPKGFQEMFMAPEWPIFNSYCGELDLTGNKKPASYYLDVVWRRSPIELFVHRPIPKDMKEHLGLWGFPDQLKSWTWNGHENDTLQIQVYTRSEKVKLELNGKIIAEQNLADNSITATFNVPYKAGKLTARCFNGDKEVATETLTTAGKPYAIRLKAERQIVKANPNDLAYIGVEIIDEAGNLVPNIDDKLIQYEISGNGSFAGVGNGNPRDMSSFQKPEKKVFQGKGLLIVKPNTKTGTIKIVAKATGLKEAQIIINTQ